MKIDSGIVWINAHLVVPPDVAAGGSKQSGFGHELGIGGQEELTQKHVIYVKKSP